MASCERAEVDVCTSIDIVLVPSSNIWAGNARSVACRGHLACADSYNSVLAGVLFCFFHSGLVVYVREDPCLPSGFRLSKMKPTARQSTFNGWVTVDAFWWLVDVYCRDFYCFQCTGGPTSRENDTSSHSHPTHSFQGLCTPSPFTLLCSTADTMCVCFTPFTPCLVHVLWKLWLEQLLASGQRFIVVCVEACCSAWKFAEFYWQWSWSACTCVLQDVCYLVSTPSVHVHVCLYWCTIGCLLLWL